MQTGLHAFSWSAKRLAVGLGILVGLAMSAYIVLVAVIVVGQAAGGLAH